jgi:sulfur-oxidizing protein SoxA
MIRLICLVILFTSAASAGERRSGYDDMTAELQQMQDDPFANPGMLWVSEGGETWITPEGLAGKSCADCHGVAEQKMVGLAARYPAFDDILAAPVDLPGRVNLCRTRYQGADPLERESHEMLAVTAFLSYQSDGLPIAPPEDPRLESWRRQGESLFRARMGQLNLACATCHEDRAGGHLAAAEIPQGHPTGYPQYRLEWQDMGSLQRRFGNCLFGIRAEAFGDGSEDYIALELYLKQRAAGMSMEAPAIRP